MQYALLKCLADGQQHSGNDLAAALGVSRAAIWKHVEQLRILGIEVAAQAGQGYQLPAAIELLEHDRILDGMSPGVAAVVSDLEVLWVTTSTSDVLLRASRVEPGNSRVCFAEYQTGGRGRRGRQWFAAVGSGICVSVSWCFSAAPASLSCLSLAAGVAVLRAVRACGVRGAELKWPNDLVAAGRKLAGILVDVQGEAGGPLYAVVGIGLNYAPDPVAAEAIAGAGGLVPVTMTELSDAGLQGRNHVAATLVAAIIEVLQEFEATGFAVLADEWRDADFLRDKPIQVTTDNSNTSGIARGISSDGHLIVETNGNFSHWLTGEVSVRAAP